jgi:hypothetical protein
MASELILILRDFFSAEDAAARDASLPRLPALETYLARARREPSPQGWRAQLASRFGTALQAALAPAALAARAWLDPSGEPSNQYWFATPVHCFAGLDTVHLHPAGLLELPGPVQTALAADFSSVFGAAPWRLHPIGGRELLLSGAPLAASGEDPTRFVGRELSAGLPRGAAGATLRRLGVEIEMWLHEHRINRERQAAGQLPVSALWLWGAAAPDEARIPAATTAARLYGQDTFAQALWRLRGARAEPLPDSFAGARGSLADSQIVLYPTLSEEGLGGALQRLEESWLAPALEALRKRELSGIDLLTADRAYRLRRAHRLRFWRTPSPWWKALA